MPDVGTQGFEGLLFFLPTLALANAAGAGAGSARGEAGPGLLSATSGDAQDADSLRRCMARYLLGSESPPLARKELVAAMYSASARLRRAQHLLRDAEQHEAAERWVAARDLWQAVDREWQWVASSSAVAKSLSEAAATVAPTAREAAVNEVRAAVTGELLPVFHLRRYLKSSGTDQAGSACREGHREYLTRWHAPINAPDGLVRLYRLFLEDRADGLEQGLGGPAVTIDREAENVLVLLRDGRATASAAHELARSFARLAAGWMKIWLATKPQLTDLERTRSLFERIEAAAPPNLTLLELLSVLHVVSGDREGAQLERVDASIRHYALANTYDPFDRSARERLKSLEKQVVELRAQAGITADDQGGQASLEVLAAEVFARPATPARERAAALTNWLQKSLNEAGNFPASSEGVKLRTRRAQAVRLELAVRLGLDPWASSSRAVLDGLVACLDAAAGVAEDAAKFPATVRAAGASAGGAVAQLDWDAISAALTKAPYPDAEILALVLPKRPRPSPDPELVQVLDSARATPGAPASVRGRRSLAAWTWLCSSQDAPIKALAGVGLLLVLHGGGLTLMQLAHDRVVSRAYAGVVDGARGGDDAAVIAHAEDFLHQMRGEGANPRVQQVLGLLREATLREVMRLDREGQAEQTVGILQRYANTARPYDGQSVNGAAGDGS